MAKTSGVRMTGNPAMVALVVAEGAALEALASSAAVLDDFGIAWEQFRVLGDEALASGRTAGWGAIIVASVDARHPDALAATTRLPVVRVPSSDGRLGNLELLWTTDHNLPGPSEGETFATMAIGEAGAKNAALFVVALLALTDERLSAAWSAFRERQTQAVLDQPPLA